MRSVFSLLFILIAGISFGQWKDFKLNHNKDTLNRVDMQGRKQGPWTVHVDDLRGERGYEEEGYYEDDMKTGVWKKFSLEGVKIAEESYSWGRLNGTQKYYTYNGGLMRLENWRAIDPKQLYDTVPVLDVNDPSIVVRYVVVKNDGKSIKHGKWTYFDPREGSIEATENYVMGKLQMDDESLVESDDLKPIDISKNKRDTAGQNKKPQAVLDYEKKNSGKKKIKSRDGQTGY